MADKIDESNHSEDTSPLKTKLVRYGITSRHSIKSLWLWAAVALFLIVAGLALGAYPLRGKGGVFSKDPNNWVAPKGVRVAGTDISGQSIEDINRTLSTIVEEFSSAHAWLVNDAIMFDASRAEVPTSTSGIELPISVVATDLGLQVDISAMKRDLETLQSTSKNLTVILHRFETQSPPDLPIKLSLDEAAAKHKLGKIKSMLDRAPVNAKMDLANRKITPSRQGVAVDLEITIANIPRTINKLDNFPITLASHVVEPQVDQTAFEAIDLTLPLATFTSKFNPGKVNRSKNIEMVAKLFEEVAVGPGEIFSFNKTTGPRTAEEGYLPAPMYVGKKVELSPAGGACQVSTTLYNSALLAGLEIVERHPHSRPCTYVPYGQDAAVAYEAGVDLKFKNTLSHAVIIHQVVNRSGGNIKFEIYGNPLDRVKVSIKNAYTLISRPDTSTTYIVDKSLAPGKQVVDDSGCKGITQRAWRVWYDEAGAKVRDEPLSSDHLNPIGKTIRYNPAPGTTGPPSSQSDKPAESPGATPDSPPQKPSPDEPPGVF